MTEDERQTALDVIEEVKQDVGAVEQAVLDEAAGLIREA